MIGDCAYWVQAVFWVIVLALLGVAVGRMLEAAEQRRHSRERDYPWL